jgi:hypothetical protein
MANPSRTGLPSIFPGLIRVKNVPKKKERHIANINPKQHGSNITLSQDNGKHSKTAIEAGIKRTIANTCKSFPIEFITIR